MKIVITHWVHDEVLSYLRTFSDQVLAPTAPGQVWPRGEVIREASTADALITCMADSIDETFLCACPKLKIIAATLKGYDSYDVDACTKHGVWLTNVPDTIIPPTAELAVTLALGIMRNVRQGDERVRSREFKGWRPDLYGSSLRGSTVGMVGMGNLGQSIARLLEPFGTRDALYFDENPVEGETPWKRVNDLGELLSKSNLIIVSLPLNSSTHHLLSSSNLRHLQAGSYIVNIGRGSVVSEDAILEALDSGVLAGYAADVFEFEDWALPSRPEGVREELRRHERTLFTPHLGSAVDDVRREMSMSAARSVREALVEGKTPRLAVNTDQAS